MNGPNEECECCGRILNSDGYCPYCDGGLDPFDGFVFKQYRDRPYFQPTSDPVNISNDFTRVEVIDETGRVYSRWGADVELSSQDDGKTLKVFVKDQHGS